MINNAERPITAFEVHANGSVLTTIHVASSKKAAREQAIYMRDRWNDIRPNDRHEIREVRG